MVNNKTFFVDQKHLNAILAAMQPVCNKRTAVEMTSSILFTVGQRELTLKATDLEISLQASCPIFESNIFQQESFLVNGRRVFEVIREFNGDVQIGVEVGLLVLTVDQASVRLNIQDAHDFPKFPERIENLMRLDVDLIVKMIDKVAFLIPQSGGAFTNGIGSSTFQGLFFEINSEGLKMTTTDGHCLAQVQSSAHVLENERSWTVPRRAIMELKKIIELMKEKDLFVGICGKQLVFSGETFNFFTKTIAEPFPAYANILDKTGYYKFSTARSNFLRSIRRSVSLLSNQFIATKLIFYSHEAHLFFVNKEVGTIEEKFEIKVTDDFTRELVLKFYAPYLLNVLQILAGDHVCFFIKNAEKPIIFSEEEENISVLYLIMPVAADS